MRTLSILAICVAAGAVALPATVHGQTSGPASTQTDSKQIWEKIMGSWPTTKGGYTVMLDISDRGGRPPDSRPGSDWFVGKGHDTFLPMGPWIVPKEF